jgi:uncharacterized membrane protein YheB (UPF0754 family)
MASVNLLTLLIPPIAGGIIGYFTNDLAITMLFRPYQAIYIGKNKLPFTPGLIPSNQERLAQKVSDTIMGSLLTPEELKKLAQKLLSIDRVKGAISWLLELGLKQVEVDKEQKTAKILANILHDLFSESLPRLLKVLARKEDFLEEQINQIFERILLDFRLSDLQSRQFSDWLLDTVISADSLRQAAIEFFTDRNIQVIDEIFREKTSGTYWVVANLFGVKNSLSRLRTFCLDEKEVANKRITELILSLEIRNRIRQWLQNLSLQNLPVSTVRQFRKTIRESVQNYLQEKGADFIQGLGKSVEWDKVAIIIINRLRASSSVMTSLDLVSEELALVLEKYLEADLEKIVAQTIPILAIDKVITEKVKATSAAELEAAIKDLVKTELQAIVNLGGILGVTIGLLQTFILLFT